MLNQIKESVEFIRTKTHLTPKVGVILGTGLGSLAKEVQIETTISYEDIPHFPVSTVESHSGKLLFGQLGGKPVVVMQGRFHYYEGYTLQQATFPVRVMKALGITHLFISNACGSVHKDYKKGSLMVINDHINLLPENPLRGKNYEELGPRFPDMSQPYNKKLIRKAMQLANELNLPIEVNEGIYAAVPGPNLETSAEYKYLGIIGAHVVGMSTVPEVLVAVHASLEVMAISVITDEGFHDVLEPVTVADVIEVASKAEPQMTKLMLAVIESL